MMTRKEELEVILQDLEWNTPKDLAEEYQTIIRQEINDQTRAEKNGTQDKH